ncbi:hypothetical protein BJ508DRAFT_376383 [Ascobolus immersus RN42]|uniref:Nudix hydrolase domain-containing protein n=1 Tax=Ascobolus immersus RN42 TaxID=1160509 RepID=A0A3N4III3_ASCIM|nr:hypothetical protein BJ508DRAFT_376383 [Ascobolus immersus RN42]
MSNPTSNSKLTTWSPLDPVAYDPANPAPEAAPQPPRSVPQINNTFGFFGGEFVSAGSSIAFHIPTGRVVLVHDSRLNQWFLPRGRKDVGEPIGVCAVREGFEESGYKGELLPHPLPTKQPSPGGVHSSKHGTLTTEPIYTALMPHFQSARRLGAYPPKSFLANPVGNRFSHLYLVQYFILTLGEDEPVRAENWKDGLMGAHEVGYESFLLPIEEAVEKLGGGHLVFEKDEAGKGVVKVGEIGYNGLEPGAVIGREQIVPDDIGAIEAWLVAEAWCAVGGKQDA